MSEMGEQMRRASERERERMTILQEVQEDLGRIANELPYWTLLDREDRIASIKQLREIAQRMWSLADMLAATCRWLSDFSGGRLTMRWADWPEVIPDPQQLERTGGSAIIRQRVQAFGRVRAPARTPRRRTGSPPFSERLRVGLGLVILAFVVVLGKQR